MQNVRTKKHWFRQHFDFNEAINKKKGWLKIKTYFDNYIGNL